MEKGYSIEVLVESSGKKEVFFTTNEIKKGDYVVIDTEIGEEVGVVFASSLDNNSNKPISRIATQDDIKKYEDNKVEASKARAIFNEAVEKLHLDMKLINTSYTLDKSKVLFSYVSEERVDFRELLKELSSALKCRIELKQIGPRDRSKMIGGIGICGLPLCCKSFLNEFEGVSINMAKNQYLALNIQKLSGHCNKLLCCLKYEEDDYNELKKEAPKYGFRFRYDGKDYKVSGINLLTRTVKIESNDKEIIKTISYEELNEMIKK